MKRAELRHLAQMGAEARLEELQREIVAVYRAFPDLRRGRSAAPSNPHTASVRRAVAGVRGAVEGAVTRRRRPKMSPQARKRIAEAQRKRWAEWRMKQANQSAEQNTLVARKKK